MKKAFLLFIYLSLAAFVGFGPVLADDAGYFLYLPEDAGSGIADPDSVVNIIQITANPYQDGAQCWGSFPWSPDGKWIVYQAAIGGSGNDYYEICKVKADGTGFVQLTDNYPLCDSHASFTPDGTKIVYQHEDDTVDNEEPRIYIMNADGTGKTNLSAVSGTVAGHQKPVISPDGTMICYRSQSRLWVMDIDGTGPGTIPMPVVVSGPLHGNTKHTWSPDSQYVLFNGSTTEACEDRADREDGFRAEEAEDGQRIYRVKYDGSGLTMLSDDIMDFTVAGDSKVATDKCDNWAFYSPDGTKIAYHTYYYDGVNSYYTLSLMNADGTGKQQLVINSPAYQVELVPIEEGSEILTLAQVATRGVRVGDTWSGVCGPKSWSPDSKWVAFKMTNAGDNRREIFAYNIETNEVRWLTKDYYDYRLWWSTDGGKILFRDYGNNRDLNTLSYDLLVINLTPGFLNQDNVTGSTTENVNTSGDIEDGDNGQSAGVTVGTEGGDTATVNLTKYSDNPTGLAFNGAFYDLFLSDPGENVTQIVYRIYFEGTATTPYWFDGTSWVAITGYDTVNGPFSAPFDAYDGYIEITITDASTPSLDDLGGTVFGLGEPEGEDDGGGDAGINCFIKALFNK